MTDTIPVVNYLRLGPPPVLVATECVRCGARYLGHRVACAHCGEQTFVERELPREGTVGAFTIIHRAAQNILTPYVSALVDLDDGTIVKANIVGCEPHPDHVTLGMRVSLTTFEAGVDGGGTKAVAFAFEPRDAEAMESA